MLQETTNTFRIVTRKNTVKVLPKSGTVFAFELRDHLFRIYGNQFKYSSGERAAKKFKDKPTVDL
jgi:ribonuclease P protein subunit POP4